MSDACIWIDPARCGGRPCLNGTRLYLSHPSLHLADPGYTLDMYRDDYDIDEALLSDRDILAAVAWWVLNDRSRRREDRRIRKAWREWGAETWERCWDNEYEPTMPPSIDDRSSNT